MTRMASMLTLLLLLFFTTVTAEHDNVCLRPELADIALVGLQRYFNPGATLSLACRQGYTSIFGPRKIVCSAEGEWSKTKFKCIPIHCPYPDLLANGEMDYEDTVYQSTINYTCHTGYILNGAKTSVCLANGTWSPAVPRCNPVLCGLAPIPTFGMIIYDKRIEGNTTQYGDSGTYKCLPPYVLFGQAKAECTASGEWTVIPQCRVVTCPPPRNIEEGYMSVNHQKDYDFMETVKYGCNRDFVLEGTFEIVCQEDGKWSEKPSCKAPCSFNIQRARIFYKGKKIWIHELSPQKILHNEIVSFYCKDKERGCGYAMPAQCTNGNLIIPECFEEPSSSEYNLFSSSLPSEITQC